MALKTIEQISRDERHLGLSNLLEVTDKLNKQFDNMQELSKSHSDYRQEKEVVIITLNNQLQEERLRIVQLTSVNEQLKLELASLGRKVQEQDIVLKANESEKSQMLEASKADKQVNMQLNDTIKTMNTKLSDLECFLQESDKSRNELQRKYADAEKKVSVTSKQLQKVSDEMGDLQRTKADVLEQLQKDKASYEESQNRLSEMNVKLEETISTLLTKIAQQDAALEDAFEVAEAKGISLDNNGAIAELQKVIEAQNIRISDLEGENKRLGLLGPIDKGLIQKYAKEMEDLTTLFVRKEAEVAREAANFTETKWLLDKKLADQENENADLKIQIEEQAQFFSMESRKLQQDVAALMSERSNLGAQISKFQQENARLAAEHETTAFRYSQALKNLEEVAKEKSDVGEQVAEFLKKEQALELVVEKMKNSQNELTETNSILSATMHTQKAIIDSQNVQIASLTLQQSEANANYSNLSSEFADLRCKFERKSAEIHNLTERKEVDSETIVNLQSEVEWMKENLSELEIELNYTKGALIDANQSLASEAEAIKNSNALLEEKTQLVEKVESLTLDNMAMKETMLKFEHANKTLESQRREQVEQYQSSNAIIQQQIAEERQRASNLEAEVSTYAAQHEENLQLKEQIEKLNVTIEGLENECDMFRQNLEYYLLHSEDHSKSIEGFAEKTAFMEAQICQLKAREEDFNEIKQNIEQRLTRTLEENAKLLRDNDELGVELLQSKSLALQMKFEMEKHQSALTEKDAILDSQKAAISTLKSELDTAFISNEEIHDELSKLKDALSLESDTKNRILLDLEKGNVQHHADSDTIDMLRSEIEWLQENISVLEKSVLEAKDSGKNELWKLQSSFDTNLQAKLNEQATLYSAKMKDLEGQKTLLSDSLKHQEVKANEALAELTILKESHCLSMAESVKRLEQAELSLMMTEKARKGLEQDVGIISAEVSLLQKRLGETETLYEDLTSKADSLRKENELLLSDIDAASSHCSQLNSQIKEQADKYEELYRKTNLEIFILEEALKHSKSLNIDFEQDQMHRESEWAAKYDHLVNEKDKLEGELQQFTSSNLQNMQKLKDLENSQESEKKSKLEKDLEELSSRYSSLEASFREQENILKSVKLEFDKSVAANKEMESAKAKLLDECSMMRIMGQTEKSELEATIAELEKRYTNEIKTLQQANEELRAEKIAQMKLIVTLQADLKDIQKKVEEEKLDLKKQLELLQILLNQEKDDAKGFKEQVFTLKIALETISASTEELQIKNTNCTQEVQRGKERSNELKEIIDNKIESYRPIIQEIEFLRKRNVTRTKSAPVTDTGFQILLPSDSELSEKEVLINKLTSIFKFIDDYKENLMEAEKTRNRKLNSTDLKQSLSGYFVQFDPPDLTSTSSATNLHASHLSDPQLKKANSNSRLASKFAKHNMNQKPSGVGIDISIKKSSSPKSSPNSSFHKLNSKGPSQRNSPQSSQMKLSESALELNKLQMSPQGSPDASPKASLREDKISGADDLAVAISKEIAIKQRPGKDSTPTSPINSEQIYIPEPQLSLIPRLKEHSKSSPTQSPIQSPKNSPKGVYKKGKNSESPRSSTSSSNGPTKVATSKPNGLNKPSNTKQETNLKSSIISSSSYDGQSEGKEEEEELADIVSPISAAPSPLSQIGKDLSFQTSSSFTSDSVRDSDTVETNSMKKIPPPVRRQSKPKITSPPSLAPPPSLSPLETSESTSNPQLSRRASRDALGSKPEVPEKKPSFLKRMSVIAGIKGTNKNNEDPLN